MRYFHIKVICFEYFLSLIGMMNSKSNDQNGNLVNN